MSDLIRREDVRKMLCRLDNEEETIITAIAALSDIPTAYDVDKVIKQIRETEICPRCLNNKNSIEVCATFCDVGKRLMIIKAGGANE